jgi:drug/metabolite transporter (DMT)-like permease
MVRSLTQGAIGILCVIGAVFTFTAVDMIIKGLSGDYPLHQVVMARAGVALLITLAIFVPLEGGFRNLRTNRPWLHMFRGLSVVVANSAFFFGIASMPLADATAIFFFAPLAITALSVPFLGEKVGPRRWVAVIVGMIGVIIVIRPGAETFQVAAIGPLIAALAYASLQIATRKIGVSEKASTMAFYIQFTFIIVCSTMGLTIGDGRFAEGVDNASIEFLLRAWVWPEAADWTVFVGMGTLSAIGAYLISQGYRLSEATAAAPFEYVALPLAVFWGIVMFDEWPDWVALAGISLIVASGLYAFWRENVRGSVVAAKHPLPRNR